MKAVAMNGRAVASIKRDISDSCLLDWLREMLLPIGRISKCVNILNRRLMVRGIRIFYSMFSIENEVLPRFASPIKMQLVII